MSKPHHGFPSGYFKIRSRLTGKCIEVAGTNNGADLYTSNCHNGHNQQWFVNELGCISNRTTGKSIDIYEGNRVNGARVKTWNNNGNKTQQWYVDNIGRVISRYNAKSLSFDENNKGNAPLYMWDNYNGPSQRWYFERLGGDQTVQLLKNYNGKQGVKMVPSSMISASAACTYQCWMKLGQFKGGLWKMIFCKSEGHVKTKSRSPGLWIQQNKLKFHARTNTTKGWNDGIKDKSSYTIPLRKWVNVALQIRGKRMLFYVNGKKIMDGNMKGHMVYNSHDLWVGKNNKDLKLKDLEYTNYALTQEQIRKSMNESRPAKRKPKSGPAPSQSLPESGVHITKLTSNGSHPKCRPDLGRLGALAWCAKTKSNIYYLEAQLDKHYNINKIMTQGRSNSNQWTTKYSVKYLDNSGQWKKVGDFDGNKDRHTIRTNTVDFVTNRLRIYPLRWKGWPSLRLGLDGVSSSESKCAKYKEDSVHGKSADLRKTSLDAYNQECRKVAYFKYLEDLKQEKSKYEGLYDLLNKSKKSKKACELVTTGLKTKMSGLRARLKSTKLDLELAKSKKCPPVPTCLPVISAATMNTIKKPTINDYDIRTHREFHKYVLASAIKPCPAQTQNQGACSNRFISEKKLDNNIVKMFGGGVYGKLCTITNDRPSVRRATKVIITQQPPKVEHAYDNDPYDIRKHKDFSLLMKNYIHKSDCKIDKSHPQFKKLMKKYTSQEREKCLAVRKDISKHPQYRDLMNKYAKKRPGTCPVTYMPCPSGANAVTVNGKVTQTTKNVVQKMLKHGSVTQKRELLGNIKNHPDFKDYVHVSKVKSISQKLLQDAVNEGKLTSRCHTDISKHPGYKALMMKYALPDNTKCPTTYHKCKDGLSRKLVEIPITRHPDIKKYVKRADMESIKSDVLLMASKFAKAKAIINDQRSIIKKLKNLPIDLHPKYNDVVPGQISQHPDIHKYILKSQIPGLIDKECKKHFSKKEKVCK